ncbi:predicted protein [Histoplasma capsulatum G186AR]|uniref:Uncharacterized protein n=1 Tax=Ajellomyces capsulatus (strain G186AR / H82 / ATCC MYA-2454 / RMSCC 2432) TaxID=447093 RepID=C0NWN2_AJECG|nr:uncharacterized protein HCBG_07562 [Histoplasma capsulatum G186AR]EEH04337.1 predicted protein [Histoplasma capsulatum G186AR]
MCYAKKVSSRVRFVPIYAVFPGTTDSHYGMVKRSAVGHHTSDDVVNRQAPGLETVESGGMPVSRSVGFVFPGGEMNFTEDERHQNLNISESSIPDLALSRMLAQPGAG